MNDTIDFSTPFLKKVNIETNDKGINISCMGETICFIGDIIKVSTKNNTKTNNIINIRDNVIYSTIISPIKDMILEYHYFDGEFKDVDNIIVKRTNYNDICVFLRKNNISFFLSFDFPYSKITTKGSSVNIGCDPLDEINKNEEYHPHTLTIGASVLTGRVINGIDKSEIEAFSEYINSRINHHFNGSRPITIATSITNRLTDLRDGRVYYSIKDNPTLYYDKDTLKKEIEICSELGIEYYQLFEGYFDFEEDGSSEKALKEVVEYGKKLGVRVGDYMTALELNCWHFNYHHRHVEDKSLLALQDNGSRYYLCYGNIDTLNMLNNTIYKSIVRNKEEMICIDGNCYIPCLDESHGHNANSPYKHIKHLTDFFSELNDISPYFLTWTNAGNWLEFMPKLLWYNPNVYLSDPHERGYKPTLNCLKYFGDARREQMVTLHNEYFVPYTAYSNCEYYAFRHSRIDDEAFFEYSFLQGLSVTPNICFGELRTFLERTSSKRIGYVKEFIKKWLKFIKNNIDSWKYVYEIGDFPQNGANEAYAHINKDHGYVILVNQNHYPTNFKFNLNNSIGLVDTNINYILKEIYPNEYPIYEQNIPFSKYGDEISLTVDPYSVRIIEIKEFVKPKNGYILYGISEDIIDKTNDSLVIKVDRESGKSIHAAAYFVDKEVNNISVKTKPNVPMYYFESSLNNISINSNVARFDIEMPRDKFINTIDDFIINDKISAKLNYNNSDFAGGFIHNLYKENQVVYLTIETNDLKTTTCESRYSNTDIRQSTTKYTRGNKYTAFVEIPFIEMHQMGNRYGFDECIELVFKDSNLVKNVRASIDGNEVAVNKYEYPFMNGKCSYYIELTGKVKSGSKFKLELNIDWNDIKIDNGVKEKEEKTGRMVIGE